MHACAHIYMSTHINIKVHTHTHTHSLTHSQTTRQLLYASQGSLSDTKNQHGHTLDDRWHFFVESSGALEEISEYDSDSEQVLVYAVYGKRVGIGSVVEGVMEVICASLGMYVCACMLDMYAYICMHVGAYMHVCVFVYYIYIYILYIYILYYI